MKVNSHDNNGCILFLLAGNAAFWEMGEWGWNPCSTGLQRKLKNMYCNENQNKTYVQKFSWLMVAVNVLIVSLEYMKNSEK